MKLSQIPLGQLFEFPSGTKLFSYASGPSFALMPEPAGVTFQVTDVNKKSIHIKVVSSNNDQYKDHIGMEIAVRFSTDSARFASKCIDHEVVIK